MDGEHDVETCPEEVARRTLQVLRAAVPPEVPGVAFASGGHSNERACANLAANRARAGAASDTSDAETVGV